MNEASRGVQTQRSLLTVVTNSVASDLSPAEVAEAVGDIKAKMPVQDPLNPNLWVTEIRGKKLWGVLDERAGPEGEDVLTIMFPSDY